MNRRLINTQLKEIRKLTKNLIWLSPQNLEQERKKFFSSRKYNPQLRYPSQPTKSFISMYRSLQDMADLEVVSNDVLLQSKAIETQLKLKLIQSLGNPKVVTETSEKLYQCTFAPSYINKAKKHAKIKLAFTPQESYSPRETQALFYEYLASIKINNWKVTVSRRTDFYMQIRAPKRTIRISKAINWDFATLDSTLAHEIDGHVLRSINARKHKKREHKYIFPFYIKTEEGLASFLGDYCAKGGKLSLKHHALKYLAGYIALSNSFRETYNFLLDNGFTPDLAFQRTFRLKRGLTDTSAPGCFAREAMYYEGLIDVKRYLDEGGDARLLMAGKISLAQIGDLPFPKDGLIPNRLSVYLKKVPTPLSGQVVPLSAR